jgi:lysozyme family protein
MIGFDEALAFILRPDVEGGYVNDPRDPGGETKCGISKRSYPHLDIKNLTDAEIKDIYLRDFWNALRLGELPGRLAFLTFNSAVNQGQPSAAMILQQALGLKADGIIGPETIEAANKADLRPVLRKFVARQLLRYVQSKNFILYAWAWVARTVLAFEEAITL